MSETRKFQKGDTVVRLLPGFSQYPVGSVAKVVSASDLNFKINTKQGNICTYGHNTQCWALLKAAVPEVGKRKAQKEAKKYLYTFRAAPDAVDYEQIYEDSVSRDNPLAIVKVKGHNKCVAIVHESIARKGFHIGDKMVSAGTSGCMIPETLMELEDLGAYFGGPFEKGYYIDFKDCARIKELVGKIHHAKWTRRPSLVTVQRVNV